MRIWAFAPAICLFGLIASSAVMPAAGDRRRAEVEAFVKKADDLIHDNNYDVKSTAHYKVKTDDPRFDVLAAASFLESFHEWFETFWKGRAELLPAGEPMRVYLFYSRAKFRQLGVYRDRPDRLELVGHYQGFYDLVALHTDTVPLQEFADELLHEAAHQLVQRRLYGMDNRPAPWVTEGLAEYFGNTLRPESGGFQEGKIGGKEVSLFRKVRPGSGRYSWPRVRVYRRALAEGRAVTVDGLLRDDEATFYGEGSLERYTAAWMLAHYLLHADGGAHVAGFAAFIRHDAAGEGGAQTFYGDLGTTPDRLAAAFSRYLHDLDPR